MLRMLEVSSGLFFIGMCLLEEFAPIILLTLWNSTRALSRVPAFPRGKRNMGPQCVRVATAFLFALVYRHQEFQFLLLDVVHCGTESEHHVLNGSHIFLSFTGILLLFGTKFQYSCKRRQDEEGKQSDKAAIRDLVLTFCPTKRSVQQRKLKLLMLVYE